MSDVRCSFELRSTDDSGSDTYTGLRIDGPHSDGMLRTEYPPAVGDTIFLVDQTLGGRTYRVVARDWEHPAYGSPGWPREKQQPISGPLLRCLVERAPGVGRDEVPYG
ncbi:hypothetical protein ACWEKT_28790 [Nocardia takedensis]